MEKIGIICEYNPFHNGHIYHINKIKEMYPDSIIILVLNGYFLQRGEISLISKYNKSLIALNNKVDLIIELPVLFGSQSADNFAYNSVYLLNKLKIDKLLFGSELNDIEKLKQIANAENNENYNDKVKYYLNMGCNYPTALAKSINIKVGYNPNDLLGISYIKAINKINPNIIPVSIKRTNDYHDINSNDTIISASNIRNKINNNENIDKYIPDITSKYLNTIDNNLLFKLIKFEIINNNFLEDILDVDESLKSLLIKNINKVNNLNELTNKIKSKRYTYNRINRMYIHLLLNIKKNDANIENDYIKIIGFNNKGKEYLNKIKKDIDISLKENFDSKIYQYEIKAAMIYDLLCNTNEYDIEKKNKPIIYES